MMVTRSVSEILERHSAACARRAAWEGVWRDCYAHALPSGDAGLYDATAADAAEQLAASLLANLTPPWSQWFGFRPGPDLGAEEAERVAPHLAKAARCLQAHLDRSNFAVEMHQACLDLVIGGTGSLMVEEAEPGDFSALKFTAIPLASVVMEEGARGALDTTWRTLSLTLPQIRHRYPEGETPVALSRAAVRDPQARFEIVEGVLPQGMVFRHVAALADGSALLRDREIPDTPFLHFRWSKSPGDVYGRSPVMAALPDIRTANKVVELILKNASIAVTGIWQADDDGVLNPATVALVPGAIIPKAVGSQGLKPLEMPGRFDVSQLVLEDLRGRIRHTLLADRLGPVTGARMTATEVLERSAEMALLLGATYGRLQVELLVPLVRRALAILVRRGEVPDLPLDGRLVTFDVLSPLARAQGQRNVQNVLFWLDVVRRMGDAAADVVDGGRAARFLGEALAVPGDLMRLSDGEARA